MDISVMTPMGLFLNAGPVSKAVMALLLAASVWTWVLIIDGVVVALRIAASVKSARQGGSVGVLWPIMSAAQEALGVEIPQESAKARQRRIARQIDEARKEFMIDARGALPNLAIVSAVGPFVGLFGTVWGIITSFAGIAATQETSLAIVAPGIAEALAATSYGLAAAIPAAIGYNRLGATIARLDDDISDLIRARTSTL